MQDSGFDIVEERIALARARLLELIENPVANPSIPDTPLVITGLGSSEAHARYLVELANSRKPGSAQFLPTTAFYAPLEKEAYADTSLILFTQGMSSNARIALQQRHLFKETILFTAADILSLEAADKQDALEIYRELEAKNSVILLPERDEYTILLRFVGPLCGYLGAYQWINQDNPSAQKFDSKHIESIENSLAVINEDNWQIYAKQFIQGVEYNFTGEVSNYVQNLAYKRVEGVFASQPVCRELLQFAHGPFQQNIASPVHQWIFSGNTDTERSLINEVCPLFARLGSAYTVIESPLPAPFSILYFELFLNEVLRRAMPMVAHSQIQWPGKGQDGEAYHLSSPYSP